MIRLPMRILLIVPAEILMPADKKVDILSHALHLLSHHGLRDEPPTEHLWTATMTTSPLARYESFLISNASTISTIESSLRSLTWFLPGRFRDAELGG